MPFPRGNRLTAKVLLGGRPACRVLWGVSGLSASEGYLGLLWLNRKRTRSVWRVDL